MTISKVSKCNFRSADADQSVTAARGKLCQKWRKQAYFRVHLLDVIKIEQKPFSQLVGNCCPAVGLTDTQTGLSGTFPQNLGKAV